jgi:hypothetical protein
MTPEFLANIPADQVGIIIGALITALVGGGVIGKKITENKMHIEPPIPEVPTRKVNYPPTWDAHQALTHRVSRLEQDVQRMGEDVKNIRSEQASQFAQLMSAGAERELRISEKLDAVANQIHRRIDEKLS